MIWGIGQRLTSQFRRQILGVWPADQATKAIDVQKNYPGAQIETTGYTAEVANFLFRTVDETIQKMANAAVMRVCNLNPRPAAFRMMATLGGETYGLSGAIELDLSWNTTNELCVDKQSLQ